MPRYRNSEGIVVNVPADKGAQLTGFALVEEVKEDKPKPAAKAHRAKSE